MAKVGITVLEKGNGGAKPQAGDRVTMDYVGKVHGIDGKTLDSLIKNAKNSNDKQSYEELLEPFDQTYSKGVPFSFIVDGNEVIAGWDEAVKQMTLNEKSVWIIPYSKGYGERGAGASIPPKADLNFEVKLLHIHKPFKHFTIESQVKSKSIKLNYCANGVGSRFYNRTIVKDRLLGIKCQTNPKTDEIEFSLIQGNNDNNNNNNNDKKDKNEENENKENDNRIVIERDLTNKEEKNAWKQIDQRCDQLTGFGFREMLQSFNAMDVKPGYKVKFHVPCNEAFGAQGVRLSNRKWLVANGQDLEIVATITSVENIQ